MCDYVYVLVYMNNDYFVATNCQVLFYLFLHFKLLPYCTKLDLAKQGNTISKMWPQFTQNKVKT